MVETILIIVLLCWGAFHLGVNREKQQNNLNQWYQTLTKQFENRMLPFKQVEVEWLVTSSHFLPWNRVVWFAGSSEPTEILIGTLTGVTKKIREWRRIGYVANYRDFSNGKELELILRFIRVTKGASTLGLSIEQIESVNDS